MGCVYLSLCASTPTDSMLKRCCYDACFLNLKFHVPLLLHHDPSYVHCLQNSESHTYMHISSVLEMHNYCVKKSGKCTCFKLKLFIIHVSVPCQIA